MRELVICRVCKRRVALLQDAQRLWAHSKPRNMRTDWRRCPGDQGFDRITPTPTASRLEVRSTPTGDFDEVVASDAFVHVEVMSEGPPRKRKDEYAQVWAHIWMRVATPDGRSVVLNFYSDTAITVTAEEESEPTP